MGTKPLIYGLIGFFIGGLLVSITATTVDMPEASNNAAAMTAMTSMSESLKDKTRDEYDKLFIAHMIEHHERAFNRSHKRYEVY